MSLEKHAADIMKRQVIALRSDASVQSAVRLLLSRGYSGAPVVDESGRLIGVLSEIDCVRGLVTAAAKKLPCGTVADYMTKNVEAVQEDDSLLAVAEHFLQRGGRRIIVKTKDGELAGLIARRDLLIALDAALSPTAPPTTYDLLRELWH